MTGTVEEQFEEKHEQPLQTFAFQSIILAPDKAKRKKAMNRSSRNMNSLILLVALIGSVQGWKLARFPFVKQALTVAKGITATLTVASFLSSPLVSLADEGGPASFQEQLKGVAAKQVEDQKARIEKAEQDLMSKELLYPDGRLVGRGIIKLNPEGTSNQLKAFQTSFPYGYPDGPALDPAFEDEQSTMFILAVGRDGPPLAAKRIKIKDMDFPIAFELTCDDLVFPYTPDAWLASPNSHDTIALTVILTPGNVLAAPNAAGRVGFGLSEPAKVAGAFSRTTADISLAAKLDGKLYTNEEIAILSTIDNELDRISPSSKPKSSSKSNYFTKR